MIYSTEKKTYVCIYLKSFYQCHATEWALGWSPSFNQLGSTCAPWSPWKCQFWHPIFTHTMTHPNHAVQYVCDGLSKCLFPVLLINRNSMRAASCLPLKNMTYLDDVKTWKFFVTFGNLSRTTGVGERTSVFIRCRWYYLLNCVSLRVCLSECNMLLDMPADQRCFLTVSYQSVNMAVPLNGLLVDRGMYLQFSLARC